MKKKILFSVIIITLIITTMLGGATSVNGQRLKHFDTLNLKKYILGNKQVLVNIAKHNLTIKVPALCQCPYGNKVSMDEFVYKSSSKTQATFMGDLGNIHLDINYGNEKEAFSIIYIIFPAEDEPEISFVFKEYGTGEQEYLFVKEDTIGSLDISPMKKKEVRLFKKYIFTFITEGKKTKNLDKALNLRKKRAFSLQKWAFFVIVLK